MYIIEEDGGWNKIGEIVSISNIIEGTVHLKVGDLVIIWEMDMRKKLGRFFDVCLLTEFRDNASDYFPDIKMGYSFKNTLYKKSPDSNKGYSFQRIRSFEELKNGEEWFGGVIANISTTLKHRQQNPPKRFIVNLGFENINEISVDVGYKLPCNVNIDIYTGDLILVFEKNLEGYVKFKYITVASSVLQFPGNNHYILLKNYYAMCVGESFQVENGLKKICFK